MSESPKSVDRQDIREAQIVTTARQPELRVCQRGWPD